MQQLPLLYRNVPTRWPLQFTAYLTGGYPQAKLGSFECSRTDAGAAWNDATLQFGQLLFWAVAFGQGWNINSSVSTTLLNVFVRPSDGLSPVKTKWRICLCRPVRLAGQWTGTTNNYLASMGTTTKYGGMGLNGTGFPTTGIFTQEKTVYGLQNITDGSSNSIAFGESLVGDGTIEKVKLRDGPKFATTPPAAALPDISTNPTAVLRTYRPATALMAQMTFSS